MNVTFHTLASLATVAVLSRKIKPRDAFSLPPLNEYIFFAAGFAIGILIHGILDYAPHNYLIPSIIDVFLSLFLLALALASVKRYLWLLTLACFTGGIFPDLVDLGTAIINKRLGTNLPVVKIFPWHWSNYSGSIYDGSHHIESAVYHLTVAAVFSAVCYLLRDRWFRGKKF